MTFKLNFLNHSVDDVCLLHVFLIVVFKFLHDCHDLHRQFLILVKTNLYFSRLLYLLHFRFYLSFFSYLSIDLLIFILNSHFSVKFFLDLIGFIFKFDITLLDVDIRLLKKSANLSHVSRCDGFSAVSSCNGF
jgi:hypothetical protein